MKTAGRSSWIPMSMIFVFGLFLGILQPLQAESIDGKKSLELSFPVIPFLTQGDAVLTQEDITAFLEDRVPEEDRAPLLSSAQRIGEILNNLLISEHFVERARESGLLENPAIQARLYRALADRMRSIYIEQYFAQLELESYEELAREIYLTQPSRFATRRSVDFRHVLVSVEPERSEAEAMHRILEAHAAIESGDSFESIVQSYSDDPFMAENGGVYEGVEERELVPQLSSTMGRLEPGQWSDPVRSVHGWHLVQLIQHNEPETLDWERAKPRAMDVARDRHRRLTIERLLRDVQDPPVEFEPGAVALLLERHGASQLGVPDASELTEYLRSD